MKSMSQLTREERTLADRLFVYIKETIGSPTWQPGSKREQRASDQLWKSIITLIIENRQFQRRLARS